MAGTGWRTSLVRLVFGAGLLCAAWLLLGAGEARADDAPRGASTPSIGVVLEMAHVDACRSAPASANRRSRAAVHADLARPLARPVGHRARPIVSAALATVQQRPVLGTDVTTVATRVVRPVARPGEATVGALAPVVSPLSHLPVVRRLPIAPVAETLAGEGLREPALTAKPDAPRRLATQSPPAESRAPVVTTPTEPGVVHRAPEPAFALLRAVPAAPVVSTPPGGDAPTQPGDQGGVPVPVPMTANAGNCSVTTDMALPSLTPVLPQPAYERGFGQLSRSTGAPAEGPDNRPD